RGPPRRRPPRRGPPRARRRLPRRAELGVEPVDPAGRAAGLLRERRGDLLEGRHRPLAQRIARGRLPEAVAPRRAPRAIRRRVRGERFGGPPRAILEGSKALGCSPRTLASGEEIGWGERSDGRLGRSLSQA